VGQKAEKGGTGVEEGGDRAVALGSAQGGTGLLQTYSQKSTKERRLKNITSRNPQSSSTFRSQTTYPGGTRA